MSVEEDRKRIAEQEARLVFPAFDEATAFAVGSALRERGMRENLPIVIDIQTWDRPLFYCALPDSTGSNQNWARRKRNVVRMFLRSTYGLVLEKQRDAKSDGHLERDHDCDERDISDKRGLKSRIGERVEVVAQPDEAPR